MAPGRITAKAVDALRELNAERVTAIVLAGTIAGIVTLISSVSFAALMFNGRLTPFVSSAAARGERESFTG